MSTPPVWTLPRESTELVGPITVTDGEQPVAAFEVAVLPVGQRPTAESWAAPTPVEGHLWVLVGPTGGRVTGAGLYRIWGRAQSNPERPVLQTLGFVNII